ncbi:hypothetical protein Vadar_011351 [Vaccinium darrowii]|uniref:Uncharacterized protein n=1 Tax=Vaccinium darrowii TaxID=229202 RepID=A0ACB7Y7E1_9ERIC|nr:hypothetical protein Vadar_011351 [Vaccinium darrowii]
MRWKGMHVDQELEASRFCMEVIKTRRERYPNSLERSKWAHEGAKTEQKVLERYTRKGVALPVYYWATVNARRHGRDKQVVRKPDPLYYRDRTNRLVRIENRSSQSESSNSSSESVESRSESIPISGLYIDLPVESVNFNNPLYQSESESESVSEPESFEMGDQQEARNAFTVKPGVLNSLPNFYGRESDDPYEHVRTFEGLVRNLASTTQYDNTCLKLFEATLKMAHLDGSECKSLSPSPHGRMQERGESLVKAWERFKDLLLRMPHPGFEKIQLVEFFHLGLNAETIQHIEYSCKGDDFLSKTTDEGWDFLDDLADRQRALEPSDFDRSGPSGSNVIPVTIRDQRLQAQVEKMAQKLEELEVRQTRPVHEVSIEEVCVWCECKGHIATACPGFLAAKGASQNNQEEVNAVRNWDPYSNTYNPGWKDHPNFGWSDPRPAGGGQAQLLAPPPPQQFHQSQAPRPPQGQVIPYNYQPQQGRGESQLTFQTDTRQQIGALTAQMTQLTAVISQMQQEKGRFPAQGSQTGAHYVGNSSGPNVQGQNQEEAKAVTILRSGKTIDKTIQPTLRQAPPPEPVIEPEVIFDTAEVPREEVEEREESPEVVVPAAAAPTAPPPPAVPVAPFPQRLAVRPKQTMNSKMIELLKKVQFPITLMQATESFPQCAKVLKDLCTPKRKSQNNVVLTEQVSSILQTEIPAKCKDPGCPTIPIAIAGQNFDKALLDLGASVNLLP